MSLNKSLQKILLSFTTPGIVLISRKKIIGYVLYLLFLITFATPLFTNILMSFWGTILFIVIILIIFLTSIILTILTRNTPEDNRLKNILTIIAFIAYLSLSFAIVSATQQKFEKRNTLVHAAAKIAYLDTLVADSVFNQIGPESFINHIKTIPINPGYPELTKWGSGIYIFVSEDTVITAYKDPYQYFFNYNNLDALLKDQRDSISRITTYFSFSKTAFPNKTKPVLLRLKSAGITNIRVCFVKDTNNIETRACNSGKIRAIKKKQNDLVEQGKSSAEAMAIAVVPLLKSSPPFMVALDSTFKMPPDQRVYCLISTMKSFTHALGCDIEDMIDFCLLFGAPWIAFSFLEVNIDDLLSGKNNLL